MFYTIKENNETKLIEKKSVFIANLYYVETEEDANLLIKQIEKKYYDAKHHCFAYRLQNNGDIIERFSDNGEPSGTAGMPILGILRGKELTNVLVVVTRYFGGILLGTGGLVRAYADSAKQVLEEINIVKKDIGLKLMYEIQYNDLEKLREIYETKESSQKNKLLSGDFTTTKKIGVKVAFDSSVEFLGKINLSRQQSGMVISQMKLMMESKS